MNESEKHVRLEGILRELSKEKLRNPDDVWETDNGNTLFSSYLSGYVNQEEDSKLDEYKYRLSEIYCDDFRHMYSSFYRIVELDPDKADVLAINLETMYEYVSSNNDDPYLVRSIMKLYDHMSIEVRRYAIDKGSKERIEKAEKNLNNAEKKVLKATKKARNLQRELVAVLGIFAAVVIAISGGSMVLDDAVEKTVNTIEYSTFIILLCGIVLYNIIVMLFIFVDIIINNSEENRQIWKRINRYLPVIVLDLLLFAALGIVAWWII